MTKQEAFEWADDLESGKYEQVKSELRKEIRQGVFGYCCLGVECARFEAKGKGAFKSYDGVYDGFIYGNSRDGASLPEEVALELRISQSPYIILNDKISKEIFKKFPEIKLKGLVVSITIEENRLYLVSLNDSTNIGFKGIAWIIRKYWNKIK